MMMCSFGKEQPFAPRWPNNPIRIESSPTRPKNIAIQRTNFDSPESTGVNPRDEPTVNESRHNFKNDASDRLSGFKENQDKRKYKYTNGGDECLRRMRAEQPFRK